MVRDRLPAWSGRSVLVTGHTGFKGGWLAMWLHELGARVHGFALDPPSLPNLFEDAGVRASLTSDARGDLADLERVKAAFAAAQPEIVFHLAAQSLVRQSYRDPIGTLRTNVLGTAHVLEAARATESVRALLIVTTDKVYLNHETASPYSERDPLGGRDLYSASKAAAELVTAGYRESFFRRDHPIFVATARAGNVVGGADWAADRLVPDCLRAFACGNAVRLRCPGAIRPWQHVLDPISGYLELGGRLLQSGAEEYATAWNFGPDPSCMITVLEIARLVARIWGEGARVEVTGTTDNMQESNLLYLDSRRARTHLGWQPRWDIEQALTQTVAWYRAWKAGLPMAEFTREQIHAYEAAVTA